jgi:hypothetical protein
MMERQTSLASQSSGEGTSVELVLDGRAWGRVEVAAILP